MREMIMARFGEVHLKGHNRPQFLKALLREVKRAVRPFQAKAWMSDSRVYVSDATDGTACAHAVARVFGIHSVSHAWVVEPTMDAITQAAVTIMMDQTGTFKVRSRRSDKRFPLDSPAINIELGGAILYANARLSVDVHNPEHTLEVEVREQAILCLTRIPGAGGMPMGTNGQACLLLSGGIDSPVAGYRVARRGVNLCAVYFHAFPYTSDQAKDKVIKLAEILSASCGPIALSIVPITDIQMQLRALCPEELGTILLRRQMMMIAETIALREGAQALITGECIGQVASQTMESLVVTDAAVHMPVFRPLIGEDKQDITDAAERIGTLSTSNLPYEDCCTLFTPRHPVTHPKLDRVLAAEALFLDAESMRILAVEQTERIIAQVG